MGRETKFRGLDSTTGTWVHGNLVILGTGSKYIIPQNLISNEIPQWLVDRDTVGQYTGLTDKNGHEVYEGDIVETHDGIYEVTFDCGGFMAGECFLDDYWNLHGYMFKVIGNKFENPEWLEGAADE
jgi:uncharacterized phage protein (TIGR01671 family)